MSKHRDDILQDRKANFTGINAVLYVFLLDKYYRTLFYHRIGSISYIVRWIWPGYNFIVGAGSVVVKDVPDNCVVVGNPAKIIKVIDL